tara:strand:- start:108 stop:437 length:330 start_codon:yes stop_codon:yes gene_type:complete
MTCGLHTKLDAAVVAAREAFDVAHENDSLSDNDLNLLFVYYQGIKKIKEALPDHNHVTFSVSDDAGITFPDGCINPDNLEDINITIGDVTSEPVTFNYTQSSDDVVTFS